MNDICFREAIAADAGALGALHVASWRESYAGLLPEEFLGGLSADDRAAMWRIVLNDPEAFDGTSIFVAAHGGELVGFVFSGGQRDAALTAQGFDGEIGAIYVRRSAQRRGVGNALMQLGARRLLDQGRTGMSLWVLSANEPARRFYERLGGVVVGERRETQAGVALAEVAYGWKDLSSLIR